MINKIDVYNVKFGDCIYLHMKDRGVLTDCGSKSRSTLNRGRNKVLVDAMIEGIMISDPMRSLVVTHFHDDHYNLVDRFPNNSFDKVFVPDFFTRYHIRIQLYVLLMAPINSSIYRFAKEMLELIPNISIAADDDAMVWFVKKGDNIHGMEVLWPDPKENEVKRLANRLRDIFLDWAKDHTDSSSKYEVSDLIPGFVVQSERDGLFRDRIEKSVPLRLAAGDLEEFYKKALNIREDIEMPKEGLINGSLKREISQIQNSCSIVFHNTVGENTGLFLGDVDKHNFERFILPFCSRKYKCIKAAHHGTRDYFTKRLPQSEYFIISNGGRKNWPISGMYRNYYRECDFICTNNTYCEFRNSLPPGKGCKRCFECGIPLWSKRSIP